MTKRCHKRAYIDHLQFYDKNASLFMFISAYVKLRYWPPRGPRHRHLTRSIHHFLPFGIALSRVFVCPCCCTYCFDHQNNAHLDMQRAASSTSVTVVFRLARYSAILRTDKYRDLLGKTLQFKEGMKGKNSSKNRN